MRGSLLVAVLSSFLAGALLAREATRVAPAEASSFAQVAPPGEPGQPLEVSGTVYRADGRTPAAGASLYVYQTDARGHYRPDDAMANREPRLYGLLRADGRGRYSFRTIRPGSYPGSRVPQHIHYEVTADGQGTRVFEVVFDDDPFVTDEIRRRAAEPGSVYSLKRIERGADGVGRLTQDVLLPQP